MSGTPKNRSFLAKYPCKGLGTLSSATLPWVWSPSRLHTLFAPNLSRQVWGFFVPGFLALKQRRTRRFISFMLVFIERCRQVERMLFELRVERLR